MKTQILGTLALAACLAGGLSAQTFTDTFETYHDYTSGDVVGTIWDGVLNAENLEPGSDTTGGMLHWQNNGEGWDDPSGGWFNGPLLYKLVDGNFDAEVYMPFVSNVQWSDGGIIARVPDAANGENWITVKRFGTGGTTTTRWVTNGVLGNSSSFATAGSYVRLERRGTLFRCYSKTSAAASWVLGFTLDAPSLAGPLQVGLWHGTFGAGNAADRQFDDFNLKLVQGPVITVQPKPRKAVVNGSVTFRVTATGIDPLEYQWQFNDTAIPGATNATYALANVQAGAAGKYKVVVTDADGSTVSDEAALEVLTSGQLYVDDFELYHDYTTGDPTGTMWDGLLNAENLEPGSDTTGGVLHWQNNGEGWDDPSGGWYNAPLLYKEVDGNFDAEVYMPYVSNVQWSDGGIIARVPGAASGENWVTLKRFGTQNNCGARWAAENVVGNSPAFGLTGDYIRLERRGTTFRFYTKVNAGDSWTLGQTLDAPTLAGTLQVGLWHGTFGAGNAADRQFDDFTLYLPAGPTITVQPAPQKGLVGGSVTFRVTATGIDPLEYQWQFNDTAIPGATNATYALANVQAGAAGRYKVVVTDANGSTTSEAAVLVVLTSGQLYGDDFAVFHDYTGGNVTGTMWDGVLNSENLEPGSDTTGGVLHWINNGEGWDNPVDGWSSAPTLYKLVSGNFEAEVYMPYISSVQWSDGGIIARVPDAANGENWVTVKRFGPGNTCAARWATNGVAGNSSAFGVVGNYLRLERQGPTFRCYSKANAADPWTLGYTLVAPSLAGALEVGLWHGTYGAGNTADRQFEDFTLYLPAGPMIMAQPAARTVVLVGTNLTFSVVAQGTGAITYQWMRDGFNLPGATGDTLTLTNIQGADAGVYTVTVRDASGMVVTAPARLVVYAGYNVVTDDFEIYHDYAAGDVTGTIWDGVLNAENLEPGSDTTDGVLHWQNHGEGWANPADGDADGPVLYKLTDGDFEAEVYMPYISNVQWSDGGIIARVPDAANGENWVTVKRFGTGGNCSARWVTNGVYQQFDFPVVGDYVRLERLESTFSFYIKANAEDPWTLGYTLSAPTVTGTLQVGLWHGTFATGVAADRQFDNFRLAIPILVAAAPRIEYTRAGNQLTLRWEGTGYALQQNSSVNNPVGWSDVPNGGTSPVVLTFGSGTGFFRLKKL